MNQISKRLAALAALNLVLVGAPAWCQPAQPPPAAESGSTPPASNDASQPPRATTHTERRRAEEGRGRANAEERHKANLERKRLNEEKQLKAAAQRRRRTEERLRGAMTNLGFSDPALQGAVMTYIAQEEEARRPLRDQSRKVYQALRGGVPDAQVLILMSDWRSAVEADKARHLQAQTKLDAQIGYSKSPRLEAMLLLMGVVGDGPLLMPLGPAPKPAARAVTNPMPADREATQFDPVTGTPIYTPAQLEARRRFDLNGDGHLDRDETRQMRKSLTKPHKTDASSPDTARPSQDKHKDD